MRYRHIPSQLFAQNRQRLASLLLPNSLVVFNSNDIMPTNADGTMAFRQNNDLFYLSGIDQEESILILYPDAPEPQWREILFLKETSEHIIQWEGYKLTKEQATEQSGVRSVYWLQDFNTVFTALMAYCQNIYLNTNEHVRAVVEVQSRDARFVEWCRKHYPLHNYQRVAPLMHKLRAVKQPDEIDLLQTAIDITEAGFRRACRFLKPGVMEYELEAEFLHEFVRRGSRGFAYTPIVAGGANNCVLHYISNDLELKDGDLVLIDVGAEYANYNADMTRVLPVNGRFTPRQRQVYDAVLRVNQQAAELLVPGNHLLEYQAEVARMVESELIDLGLFTRADVEKQNPANPLYRKYYYHNPSHLLGLDVHDVGYKYEPFKAGMIFTVEPGIYIREEGLGIRLENNILITENGPVNLMANIPIEAGEIEELMNS